MTPEKIDLIRILADLGGTVIVVVVLIYYAYRLIRQIVQKLVVPFIKAQTQIAEAMGRQAQSMDTMCGSLNDYVGRDNSDHREILLSMRVVIGEVQKLSTEFRRFRNGHERRQAQHHPAPDTENTGA